MDSIYTERKIAIFTDSHALLEPTQAIIEDIKKRGITEIYSLGDNIGDGPNPKEVIDLLESQNVISIAGNSEEYIRIGVPSFPYLFGIRKDEIAWTKKQIEESREKIISRYPTYIELEIGRKKIALCHFANDIRFNYGRNSSTSYQHHFLIPGNGQRIDETASKQFEYTNSKEELETMKSVLEMLKKEYGENNPQSRGIIEALANPLFGGKKINEYDAIIQGHIHWRLIDNNRNTMIYSIRASGMGYNQNPHNSASYIILKEKKNREGYEIEEVLIDYDREKMIHSILHSKIPGDRIKRFTYITEKKED